MIVIVTGPALSKCCRGSGKEIPYYSRALIPGGMYRGNPNGVETFGVRATVVSSTRTSNDTVYHVVKAVFDNFDAFRKLHPSFANLTPSEMIKLSISAPLHDGAAKYYKEKGWM